MMRKILWMILLLGGYIWLVRSGNDEFVVQNGKKLYNTLITWFDDAQIELHFKKDKAKKRSRRWD